MSFSQTKEPLGSGSGYILHGHAGRRAWSRQPYARITYITFATLWVACIVLWILRYVPIINQAPLPAFTQFIGPPIAAVLAVVYGNWLRTILSRIALGKLETNTGAARTWLDPMLGNGVWATNFSSLKSICILLIVSSTSLFSLGMNYALTVKENVLSLSEQYQPDLPFPKGACALASNEYCPARMAIATTYSVNPAKSALYTVDSSISYFGKSAGASAADIMRSNDDYSAYAKGRLCANVPNQSWTGYNCTSMSSYLSSEGVFVGKACSPLVPLNTSLASSMGWTKCTSTTELPTYVIAATHEYARDLVLAFGSRRMPGDNPVSFAVQCSPGANSIEPGGRMVTYNSSISYVYDQIVLVDSDGEACSSPQLYDYSELGNVALDLVLSQGSGTDGWMDALMTAAGGYLKYANASSLIDYKPLDQTLTHAMLGVLSQVNYLTQQFSNSDWRTVYYTPTQSSFQQAPLGQILTTLVMLLASVVFLYGRRYMPDKEWQRGNLTLRLLAIDSKAVTGFSVVNATQAGLHVLDDSRLAEEGGVICLTRSGNDLKEGLLY